MVDLSDVHETIRKLRERVVRVLPTGWREDPERKCPECGYNANRQKCFWDMGGSCPRNDPTAYDPDPFETKPDQLAAKAANQLEALVKKPVSYSPYDEKGKFIP